MSDQTELIFKTKNASLAQAFFFSALTMKHFFVNLTSYMMHICYCLLLIKQRYY